MPIYRKLPETIDAKQWDGSNYQDVIDWAGPQESPKLSYDEETNRLLQAWDGQIPISVGSYLVKDHDGVLGYPWSKDNFEATWGE